jgi:hypothetical protein
MLFYFHFLQIATRAKKGSSYVFPDWLVICFFAFGIAYLYILITRSCGQEAEVFQNKQNFNFPNNGQIQRGKKQED